MSQIDLDSSALFAHKKEIPAGFKMEITPSGYRDKYILRTKIDPTIKKEDTIAEVEVIRRGGKKISAYEGGWEGSKGGIVETEAESLKRTVNSETNTFILGRPNALDGGEGMRIDGVIRYIKS